MAKDEQHRLSVIVGGLVQGVGFRHATYMEARSLGLTGWVKNLPDGRVEACFEGDRPTLESMLEWCRKGPYLSRVEQVESTWDCASGEFSSFDIAF